MSTAPTPLLFFHDTTVLLNFGLAGQLAALAHLLADGRGAWTATVAYETKRQGHKHGLPSLRDRASDILGGPLRPEAAEHRLIRDRRKDFAQPGDAPDQHLGEAETLTIIEQRSLRAVFVTDDGHVPPLTTVTCIDTWELVRACLRARSWISTRCWPCAPACWSIVESTVRRCVTWTRSSSGSTPDKRCVSGETSDQPEHSTR